MKLISDVTWLRILVPLSCGFPLNHVREWNGTNHRCWTRVILDGRTQEGRI